MSLTSVPRRALGCLAAAILLLVAGAGGAGAAVSPLADQAGADSGGGGGSEATGTGFARPVEGATLSQGFGCTTLVFEPVDLSCPGGHFHSGVDLAAPLGTPVRAILEGTAHVVRSLTGYGLHIVVDHGGGLTSLYGHLDTVAVDDGVEVAVGAVIGTVGSTGNSTGPHLHFEIRRDGIAEDPGLDMVLP